MTTAIGVITGVWLFLSIFIGIGLISDEESEDLPYVIFWPLWLVIYLFKWLIIHMGKWFKMEI